jgi:hypothetical protein
MDFAGQNVTQEQQDQLLFMMLVQQHEQIAMMGMGKLKNPSTDKIERDLSTAKYAIDTLAMLEKFTTSSLPSELKGYLTQVLNTLRLNYVDEKNADKATEKKAD